MLSLHTHTHTHTHSRTHSHLLLCSPCSTKDIGQVPASVTPVQGYNHVHISADLGPPLLSISDSLSPVGDGPHVPANEVTPTKGFSSHWSTPATGPAPQQLSLETVGRHPPDKAKPLEASLPEQFFHWHNPCSLQDVNVLDSVPQGDSQDVLKATRLK